MKKNMKTKKMKQKQAVQKPREGDGIHTSKCRMVAAKSRSQTSFYITLVVVSLSSTISEGNKEQNDL
jgi:hypothetical protein